MKKITVKILCMLLAAASVSVCAISCAKDGGETQQTDSEVVTEAAEAPDYGGAEFLILASNQDNRHRDFYVEEGVTNEFSNLIYKRNQRLQEKYNVKLTVNDEDYLVVNQMVEYDVASGSHSFDMCSANSTIFPLALSGYLMDLEAVDEIKLDEVWWNQNCRDSLSLGGKLYTATGDISPMGLLTSGAVLFNKRLLSNSKIEFPYNDVYEGNWTLDRLYELTKDLTVNTDGIDGIDPQNDVVSIIMWKYSAETMASAAGATFISKDEKDFPVLAWDIENYSNIYGKLYKVFNSNGGYIEADIKYYPDVFKSFSNGHAYFLPCSLLVIENFLKGMEDDFGILPMPKLDSEQKEYSSGVSKAISLFLIPARGESDVSMIGTLMEAFAEESYNTVTPYLTDTMASVKNVRDEDSQRVVLEYIFRNDSFDLGNMYEVPGYLFAVDLIIKDYTSIGNYFPERRSSAEAKLREIYELINS